jgi:hypothetical protein
LVIDFDYDVVEITEIFNFGIFAAFLNHLPRPVQILNTLKLQINIVESNKFFILLPRGFTVFSLFLG